MRNNNHLKTVVYKMKYYLYTILYKKLNFITNFPDPKYNILLIQLDELLRNLNIFLGIFIIGF